jgi:DENN (AEX-3) domain
MFRALSLKNIIILFEAAISEARIIFRSSYPAMLHSVSRALLHLLWPFKFSGVYIPVLPSRLLSALEAPVSYIIGIDRTYEHLELPSDDFLICDLDQDSIMHSVEPMPLPASLRQKLAHLLALACPSHISRGVPFGPPEYIKECYPRDCFVVDRSAVTLNRQPPGYGRFVGLRSMSFADATLDPPVEPPVFNGFEFSSRFEDQNLQQFLYGRNGHGTVKSVSSVQSLDPGKYATVSSRPSFSSSSTLRDLTAGLRSPARASGFWGNSFGRSSDKTVVTPLYPAHERYTVRRSRVPDFLRERDFLMRVPSMVMLYRFHSLPPLHPAC